MTDVQVEQLLNRLDEEDRARSEPGRAASDRFEFRIKQCVISLKEPGGIGAREERVPTRQLSAHEMWFLIGRFVHPGTYCQVRLITRFGAWTEVTGTLTDCRYIESGVHEAMLQFDEAIIPGDFCHADAAPTILVVDDDPAMLRLTERILSTNGATVLTAKGAKEAIGIVGRDDPDAILMDLDMPEMGGLEATRNLRQLGYRGLIMAHTATTESRATCLDAGCDGVFEKPVRQTDLCMFISSLNDAPVVSDLHHDPQFHDLLVQYVAEMPGVVENMRQSISSGELDEVRRHTRSMRAGASSHGFGVLADTLIKLETATNENDLESARRIFADLVGQVRRVRSPDAA